MFENVNTIIFDMDGTVLNTLEDLTVSVNYVLSKFDMPDHSEEEYRQFFGNGIKYALNCAVPKGTAEEIIEKIGAVGFGFLILLMVFVIFNDIFALVTKQL